MTDESSFTSRAAARVAAAVAVGVGVPPSSDFAALMTPNVTRSAKTAPMAPANACVAVDHSLMVSVSRRRGACGGARSATFQASSLLSRCVK